MLQLVEKPAPGHAMGASLCSTSHRTSKLRFRGRYRLARLADQITDVSDLPLLTVLFLSAFLAG